LGVPVKQDGLFVLTPHRFAGFSLQSLTLVWQSLPNLIYFWAMIDKLKKFMAVIFGIHKIDRKPSIEKEKGGLKIVHKKPSKFYSLPFTPGIKLAGSPTIFHYEVKDAILSMEQKSEIFPLIHDLAQEAKSQGYRLYLITDKIYPEIDLANFFLEENTYYTL
jgi:hypothetical protein